MPACPTETSFHVVRVCDMPAPMTTTDFAAAPAHTKDENRRFAIGLGLALLLILAWQFRYFWLSGFDTLSGDIADTRIEIALMEHWLSFLRGYEHWPAANFFHPWPGVLGFTEAFLLLTVPYGFARALGADVYLAHEFVHMAVRVIACSGGALVLYRIVRLPPWIAVVGGLLFAQPTALSMHVGHTQMMAFFFVPWIALGVHAALTATTTRGKVLAWFFTGALAGALPLTSFTVTWYSGMLFGICLLAWALLMLADRSFRPASATVQSWLRSAWPSAIPGLLIFIAGLVQFVRLYLPHNRTFGGGYPFEVIAGSQITPHDWFAVGDGNYLWGWTTRFWGYPVGDYESTTSLTPILFLTMTLGGVFLALRGRSLPRPWRLAALVCALGALLWLILITRFGSFTLWPLIHGYLPGGRALRALGRTQLVLPFVAVPVACVVLAFLSRRGKLIAASVLALLLVVEQGNRGTYKGIPTHALKRKTELPYLTSMPAPPKECRVFYVAKPLHRPHFPNPDFISMGYAPATDAMLLAQRFHVPTANGVSTWFPPESAPFRVDDPNYLPAMRHWLKLRGADKGVCEVDLDGRSWTLVGDLP